MAKQKYIVTGAAGFAGKYLVKALEVAGHEVVSLVQGDVDLRDREATIKFIAKHKPDGIFHLAAPQTSVGKSWAEPEVTIDENLESTLSVLAAAKELNPKPRVLFVSSSEVIGENGADPLAEDVTPNPLSPYALSKLFGEQSCRFYFEQFEVPTLVVRAFNHIGPGQRPDFVFPNLARQIAEIEKSGEGELKVGNLEANRDFSDVRDIVRAYITAMEKGEPGEIYHAGTGESRTVRSVLDALLELSPGTINVVVDEARVRPNDIEVSKSDSAKLRELGWQPEIEFRQTVEDILNEARKEVQ
jgi:GDP-4-dehydro-6-deoxy-D-mannose reductase